MKRVIALLLSLALALPLAGCGETAALRQGPTTAPPDYAIAPLAAAVYPRMAPYPDEMDYLKPSGELNNAFHSAFDAWSKDARDRRMQPVSNAEGLDSFFDSSIRQFLFDGDGENLVYSPLNVYMALAMMAELTDGDSRAQILTLLGSDSIEALRTQARELWNANYWDDGATVSLLASSLWLNEDIDFVQSTLDTLAENYYASSYQGAMGSPELNRALQSWLNENTGGLLEEQAAGVELDFRTILALATTIYFRARWWSEFSESATEPDIFHAAGGDVTADFMHRSTSGAYHWGDRFSAVTLGLQNYGDMWFVLPDEGVTPEELLNDTQAMEFLISGKDDWNDKKYLTINLSVPKFDVVSDLDLIPGLKALGITDVFDPEASDFSPMTTDMEEIYVSKAEHAARVTIDGEGVTAAAYTVLAMSGAGMPPEETVDFKLDRPFLFLITGGSGQPLFTGIVNMP